MPESVRRRPSNPTVGLAFATLVVLVALNGCGAGGSKDGDDGVRDDETVISCLDQPGTVVDEFGACNSPPATVAVGESLVLERGGAALSIPADAIKAETSVTIGEIDPDLLPMRPDSAGETLVTPVYSIAFDAAQLTNDRLHVVIDLPESLQSNFYARVKIEGGLGTEGQSSSEWLAVIGTFDAVESTLTLELSATARRFLVTVVSTDPGALAAKSQNPALAQSRLSVTRSFALATAPPDPDGTEWAKHGWAVLCDPAQFARFKLTGCDRGSENIDVLLEDLGAFLYTSDEVLTNLGFELGSIEQYSARSIERSRFPFLVFDPENRSLETANAGDGTVIYNVAYISANTSDDANGEYFVSMRRLQVDVGQPARVALHELMHAVQASEIRNAWDQDWIIEALAAATEPFTPGYVGPTGTVFRRVEGRSRDWQYPLADAIDDRPYEALEYWLSLDDSLTQIDDFYAQLRGLGPLASSLDEYVFVDDALIATGLPSLGDSYTDLILNRDADADYLHCTPLGIDCSGSDETCDVELDVPPISAQCYEASVDFTCDDSPQTGIKVMLESEDSNPEMRLIVDGFVHEVGEAVPFSGEGRIWAINTSLEPVIAPPAPVTKFVFTSESSCYLALQAQTFRVEVGSTANVGSTVPSSLDSPANERIFDRHQSVDQQPNLSTRRFLFVQDSAVPIEDSVTLIPAIGFEPFSLMHDSFTEWQAEPPDTSYRSGTGSGSLESDVTFDGTSMIITGSLAASGTTTGIPTTAVSGSGTASAQYFFRTLDAPAELTITWPCTFSIVRGRIQPYPDGTIQQTFFNESKQFGDDVECGTDSWMIPAQTSFNVFFTTTNSAGSVPNSYQGSPGGSYEIDLRAVVP